MEKQIDKTPASASAEKRETMVSVPWNDHVHPKKLLAIRLQALGDIVITLPYLQALRKVLPSTQFHFVTRGGDLPSNMKMLEKVYTVGGGFDIKRQFFHAAFLIPTLRKENYDVVIDLQRNMLSRMIRQLLAPKSFSEFDRFSLNTAGERTRSTINKLQFEPISNILERLELRQGQRGLEKLHGAGFAPAKKLIVLNPAGSFVTKSWPLENYVEFANEWRRSVDKNVQFLLLGVEHMREKALYLKNKLGNSLINLVGETTPSEAFNILHKAELVISEDSGLMHMAWVAQIPVVALFGSTRSVWSKPLGTKSVCLDSSDLECGECRQPTCRFGDVRCLARYTPAFVIEIARKLISDGGAEDNPPRRRRTRRRGK